MSILIYTTASTLRYLYTWKSLAAMRPTLVGSERSSLLVPLKSTTRCGSLADKPHTIRDDQHIHIHTHTYIHTHTHTHAHTHIHTHTRTHTYTHTHIYTLTHTHTYTHSHTHTLTHTYCRCTSGKNFFLHLRLLTKSSGARLVLPAPLLVAAVALYCCCCANMEWFS